MATTTTPPRPRTRGALATVAAGVVAAGLLASVPTPAAAAPTPAAAAPGPGLAGSATLLESDAGTITGYDVAIDAAGTSYVGWIADHGSGREVFLCVLPQGATACSGGVRSTSALGPSSATDLKVLMVGSTPTLLWLYNSDTSGVIAEATFTAGVLGPAVGLYSSPPFYNGSLEDVVAVSGSSHYELIRGPVGEDQILFLKTDGAIGGALPPVSFPLGESRLAIDHDRAVVVSGYYGAIDERVMVSRLTDSGWSGWAPVAESWTVGGAYDLVTAGGSAQLVAPVADASYAPAVRRWNGTGFTDRTSTGDRSPCAAPSHDLVTDSSGRIADAYAQCGRVTIVNQPQRRAGARAGFPVSGVPAGTIEIATTGRGLGRVVWAQLSTGNQLQLRTAPIRLPALLRTKADRSRGGKVVVKGPVSCLPAVAAATKVTAHRSKGWTLVSKRLRLDGKRVRGSINGAALAPGSGHTLVGKAVFVRNGNRSAAKAKLTFRACPR